MEALWSGLKYRFDFDHDEKIGFLYIWFDSKVEEKQWEPSKETIGGDESGKKLYDDGDKLLQPKISIIH